MSPKRKLVAKPAADRGMTFSDDNAFHAYVTGYNHAIEDSGNTVSGWKYHKGDYQIIAETIRKMKKEMKK
jgi:hypothetical protein